MTPSRPVRADARVQPRAARPRRASWLRHAVLGATLLGAAFVVGGTVVAAATLLSGGSPAAGVTGLAGGPAEEEPATPQVTASASPPPVFYTMDDGTVESGHLDVDKLCPLSWDAEELLDCAAAESLERMNEAFRAEFGTDILVGETYRTFEFQEELALELGPTAATPGLSNHGFGLAIDVPGSRMPGGYDGDQFVWLMNHWAEFDWERPAWAEWGTDMAEPWHYEYVGEPDYRGDGVPLDGATRHDSPHRD
ncbi:M15 family metallopeptidase [Demequina pelophila]|uniref:M15 family metallopeptidase n=1 Tax=Demequina pelophila TaxID=1638984 RepID=UPI00078321F9|nr:M15 family metallopeptidase [Demequina pelophila]